MSVSDMQKCHSIFSAWMQCSARYNLQTTTSNADLSQCSHHILTIKQSNKRIYMYFKTKPQLLRAANGKYGLQTVTGVGGTRCGQEVQCVTDTSSCIVS